MVLWDTSQPSPWSAGFLNRVTVPCPSISSLDLLTCCAASSMSLDSVTVGTLAWKLEHLGPVSGSAPSQVFNTENLLNLPEPYFVYL